MNWPILISFSGGLTSAFMARFLQEYYSGPNQELYFVFANTGKEREETLEFINRCDHEWGLGVVWVEAVIHKEKGIGTTHKIVDFNSAVRDGTIFIQMIEKYGLPNKSYPHCTRELKIRPIQSYMREQGKSDFYTAIGYRADEPSRSVTEWRHPIYPLREMGIDQRFIARWWNEQGFSLNLKSYEGNCDFCWKKSRRKRLTLIRDGVIDISEWQDMEKGSNFVFDRDGFEISELVKMAKNEKFHSAIDAYEAAANDNLLFEPDYNLDFEIGCFCQQT